MARVQFKSQKEQIKFFEKVEGKKKISWSEIAHKHAVSERTLRAWRSGKHKPDAYIVSSLAKQMDIRMGVHSLVDDYWFTHKAAVLGGKARAEKYGVLGTVESRRRGGRVSQARRKNNPEKYRALGCNVRKIFKRPKITANLAEVIGILLGDGTLSNYQIGVALDATVDREYAHFVQKLFHSVLGEKPSWSERKNVIELKLSGAGLVEMLEDLGLRRGNKVTHQVYIPEWIFKKSEYKQACVRGLFDTDGCVFSHKKLKKTYIGWTFTNYSIPIVDGMEKILRGHSFNLARPKKSRLYMYSVRDTIGYMKEIGSHNPKHTGKVERYK